MGLTLIHTLLQSALRAAIVCAFFAPALFAYAQFGSIEPRLGMSPAYPKPDTAVTVSLDTLGTPIAGGSIRWFVDGREVSEAANARTISLTAGGLGTQTTVEARFSTETGSAMALSAVIAPSDVDIIVESQAYAPFFYEGRAMPAAGTPVRLVAVPHFSGTGAASADIIYTWRLNGQTLFQGPRRGQNTATFDMPMAGQANVTIRAEAVDGTRAAESSIMLRASDPVVAVYEDDPFYGISPLSYTDFILTKDEVTLRAEPYFFNRTALASPSTQYGWSIDGRTVTNPSADPRTITLRRSGDVARANVSLSVRSTQGILQLARSSFRLQFIQSGF